MHATEATTTSPHAESTGALLRHFADLRDGSHGGTTSRRDKERLFAAAVALLDAYARQALDEINAGLLRDTGEITSTGVRRSATAGLNAVWALSWPEQRAARIKPIMIRTYFGIGSPHPHATPHHLSDPDGLRRLARDLGLPTRRQRTAPGGRDGPRIRRRQSRR